MPEPSARFFLTADFFPDGKLISASKVEASNKLDRESIYAVFPYVYYVSSVTDTEITIGSSALNGRYWRLHAGKEYFWFVVG